MQLATGNKKSEEKKHGIYIFSSPGTTTHYKEENYKRRDCFLEYYRYYLYYIHLGKAYSTKVRKINNLVKDKNEKHKKEL